MEKVAERKVCKLCSIEKDLSEYYVGCGKMGRIARCKDCVKKSKNKNVLV